MFRHLTAALFLSFLSLSILAAERAVVVDSKSGMPLAKASVFDSRGNLIAICGDDGSLPDIKPSHYPLTVRCLGYRPLVLRQPAEGSICLVETEYNLPELVVDHRKRQVLHLVAYIREYSTLTTYSDTVQLFREKTVDFMVPAKKTRGYKGWTHQRVLASKSYYHFTNTEGLDSVSRFFARNFSWSDLVGIFKSMEIPEKLHADGIATDTVWGKYSPAAVWRKNGDKLFLDNDILAGESGNHWEPEVYRLFNNSVEFTKFNTSFRFSDAGEKEVFPYNITGMTVNIESKGRGYDLKRILRTDDPIYITTYAELYFTDREYISVGEARKWEKNPPLGDEIGINPPPEAPELHPAIAAIVERVKNFNYDGYRLKSKTDPLYRVMEKYETGENRKHRTRRRLKDLFSH